MESFSAMLEDTKRKLGRPLNETELQFLLWVYDRYQEENKQQKDRCIS